MLKVQVSFLLVIYTYFFVPTISEKKYFLISKKKAGEPYGAILAFSFQVYKAVCLAVGSFHNAIKYGSLLVVKWPLRPPQSLGKESLPSKTK